MSSIIKHIALVPDGNRRYAAKLGLDVWKGHEAGAKTLENFLHWAFEEFDIPIVTVYALSTENLTRRTREELEHLVDIYKTYFKKLLTSDLIRKNEVRVNILGDLDSLPSDLLSLLREVMDRTKNHSKHVINFMMPYGGRFEIISATRGIVRDALSGKLRPEDITDKIFSRYLFTAGMPDPDVIIRTAEKRLSNFLLWQTAYSEVYFFDKYWPEFAKEDLEFVVNDFPKRQRRFGK